MANFSVHYHCVPGIMSSPQALSNMKSHYPARVILFLIIVSALCFEVTNFILTKKFFSNPAGLVATVFFGCMFLLVKNLSLKNILISVGLYAVVYALIGYLIRSSMTFFCWVCFF